QVDGQDRLGPRADGRRHERRVEVVAAGFDVDEHRDRTAGEYGVLGRGETVGGHDDLVTVADPHPAQRDDQRVRAAAGRDHLGQRSVRDARRRDPGGELASLYRMDELVDVVAVAGEGRLDGGHGGHAPARRPNVSATYCRVSWPGFRKYRSSFPVLSVWTK